LGIPVDPFCFQHSFVPSSNHHSFHHHVIQPVIRQSTTNNPHSKSTGNIVAKRPKSTIKKEEEKKANSVRPLSLALPLHENPSNKGNVEKRLTTHLE
jgi:hypothetical protein